MSVNPQIHMLDLLRNVEPSMRLAVGGDFASWQPQARKKLADLLGLPMDSCEPNFRVEWVHEEDGFTETRFLFESEPEVTVIAHLLVPKRENKGLFFHKKLPKLPVMICLQGHSTGMHISLGRPIYARDVNSINGGDRDFARQVIAQGYAALVLEQRGFGDRGGTQEGPACHQPAVQAMLLGRTLIGQRCWDVSRAIDVALAQFPELDADRIGIMGNSGGGTASIYAAAMDTRISVCMPSCALCGYLPSIGAQHHCLCNYIPGIALHFDMGDLLGLIAPRPLVVVNGQYDKIFPIDSAVEQVALARSYYAASGAPDAISHVVGPEAHRFYAALSWPVFNSLSHWKENI